MPRETGELNAKSISDEPFVELHTTEMYVFYKYIIHNVRLRSHASHLLLTYSMVHKTCENYTNLN